MLDGTVISPEMLYCPLYTSPFFEQMFSLQLSYGLQMVVGMLRSTTGTKSDMLNTEGVPLKYNSSLPRSAAPGHKAVSYLHPAGMSPLKSSGHVSGFLDLACD